MGRLSTIVQLPPEARKTLDRCLDDPAVTQTEAVRRVNALLGALVPRHPPVSRSAVGRYY